MGLKEEIAEKRFLNGFKSAFIADFQSSSDILF